ncbi:MAG: MerR family DNA-binding protein, partial [Candidatus Rokubacteria bacterium]|nr:MerR family DNA-binding protein [Candidatus Rokubacteria bacterium]
LRDGGGKRRNQVRALAEAKLRDIDRKLARLQAMRSALYGLLDACACGKRPSCPILEALNDSEETSTAQGGPTDDG